MRSFGSEEYGDNEDKGVGGLKMRQDCIRKFVVAVLLIMIVIISTCVRYIQVLNKEVSKKQAIIEKQEIQIEKLKKDIEDMEDLQLSYSWDDCPICFKTPTLIQIHDSFYLKCENCGLHTDYFASKKELEDYWNSEK